MQRPSVIVALNIQDLLDTTGDLPTVRTVDFSMSREALETVIDGLGRIRDQLGKMS